jgi:hypothetical protein
MVLDKGFYGVKAEVGVHCCSITVEMSEDGPGICFSGIADVTSFGITNYRYVLRDVIHGKFQGIKPFIAQRFIESEVWFVSTYQVAGNINNRLIKFKDAAIIGHASWVRVKADAEQALVLLCGCG